MAGRVAGWLARTFGADPDAVESPEMEVVYEGPVDECQIVALRLRSEGFLVEPDPMPRFSRFGRTDLPYRRTAPSTMVVSVLARDAAAARRVLEDIEPI